LIKSSRSIRQILTHPRIKRSCRKQIKARHKVAALQKLRRVRVNRSREAWTN